MTKDSIPFLDMGGDGPLLHFAHANGYPPGVYRHLLQVLAADFHVVAMAQRPLWAPLPQAEDPDVWTLAAGDVVAFLEQEGLRGVIGAGHSLGAVATMLAAARRPDLFGALVLIEPVFFHPDLLAQMAAAPDLGRLRPLVQRTLERRRYWDDREEAYAHFRDRSVFTQLDDAVIWDYVNSGLVPTEDGRVTLRYPREWEARFYTRPPFVVWEALAQLTVPVLALRGAESDTLLAPAWEHWQRLQPEATFVDVPGAGHLLPLERPLTTAAAITGYFDASQEQA